MLEMKEWTVLRGTVQSDGCSLYISHHTLLQQQPPVNKFSGSFNPGYSSPSSLFEIFVFQHDRMCTVMLHPFI